MRGQMMETPLLISMILEHAERHHADQEIVSRRVEGDIHRYTYRDLGVRSRRMAEALAALNLERGTRVATLAWNGYRHLELYYAVSGAGFVLHMINPRLHEDQVVYIAGHAEDEVLFFDLTFLPLAKALAARNATIKVFVAMVDRDRMPPDAGIPGLVCYEDLVDSRDGRYEWPVFDENEASSMCYTSGTTGHPKGVVYSHRSTVLHTFTTALPDSMNCSASEAILPVVPMFHVNAWGLPYAACMAGSKLVLPGPGLDGKSLHELLESEKVTFSAGVPTVWQGLLAYVEGAGVRFSSLRRLLIGGAACPLSLIQAFQEKYGVQVTHAWGMTEMSPLGTICAFKPGHERLSKEQRYAVQVKQGRAVFGMDFRIVNEQGEEVPWDGTQTGELQVRGPWILSRYFKADDADPLDRGWFPTGDVTSIDADGYMKITDRRKDVIKSGGEWIGSLDLENIAVGHPAVAMAACIAVRHRKWGERPLLVVVKKPGAEVTREDLLAFYQGKVAKWWTPDDVVFVESLPIGPTGKLQKNRLREQFKDYELVSG